MAGKVRALQQKQRLNVRGMRTVAANAFHILHEAVLNGRFEPGERLRIEELAEEFEISPTPIREALQRLEAAGLVEKIPHCGARVATVSLDDLKDIYDARLLLEPYAIGKAAERFTEQVEATARAHLAGLKAAAKRKDYAEACKMNTAFHFTLYSASGSPWLLRLITPLWDSSRRYRLKFGWGFPYRVSEHERMLQACGAHDSQLAALELYKHLAGTANRIASKTNGKPMFECPLDDLLIRSIKNHLPTEISPQA
jgi:DNA-binding GntR family transcriptional regulator